MSFDLKNFKEWIRVSYDKLILFLTLSGLLVSVVLLLIFLEREKRELAEARWEQPVADCKQVALIDLRDLHDAIEDVAQPYQIEPRATRMMVAEVRTACVQCQRPIPFEAVNCPYKNCGVEQPHTTQEQADKDSDGDGMPDEWEKKYGLNPLLDDADLDLDGDGFTNLEEYLHKTDPTSPHSFPPLLTKLKIVRIGRMPMPLSFQGVQRLTAEDVRFTVRDNRNHRDHYISLGGKVEGYEIVGFEPKTVKEMRGNLPIEVDRSILRLRKDGREVLLVLGRGTGQGELMALAKSLFNNSELRLHLGSKFTLQDTVYKVIDIQEDAIVVLNETSGKKTRIKL
jgi:hypothetical protein